MNSPSTPKTGMLAIQYDCHRCKTVNRVVLVRARAQEEDVVAWMRDVVGAGVAEDHYKWAPYCSSQKCDLKIPLPPEGGWIGQEVTPS